MSTIAYANPQAPAPKLGALGSTDDEHRTRTRQAAVVPLVIMIGAQLIFFLQYWLPETSRFPTRGWWLTELAPLASKALTSSGESQVSAQDGPWGVTAFLLLIASFAVFIVCRSPRIWLGPWLMAVPWALGLVASLIIVAALALSGRFTSSLLAVLLLIVWLACAGFATVGKIFDEPSPSARRSWRHGLPVLIAYAIIGPVPTAVGRWLFGAELRDAAADLQHNLVALRLAALWTPGTALFYLCGLVVGIGVWVAYQWWPPRERVLALSLALVAFLLLMGGLGWPTSSFAGHRVTTLRYESPQQRVHFACGSFLFQQQPSAQLQPALTVAFSGFSCKTVTTYSGYTQVSTQNLPATLSPVHAKTPEGAEISGRYVAAQYGDVIVVAGSNRLGAEADQLFGLGALDGTLRWQFSCGSPRPRTLAVRFAKVPTGENPALGHQTLTETKPRVVVTCDENKVRFDPATGPKR